MPLAVPNLERVRVERCERDLHYFVQHAWHVLEHGTPFVDGWHIGMMCEVAMAVLPHRHIRNVIINIPPRHMKSMLFSVLWQAWLWGPANQPHLRVINASYSGALSIRDSLKVRRLIKSDWYQQRWGHRFKILADQDTKTRYDNDATGFRFSTSVGGFVTGEGGHLINIDDAIKASDALSEKKRARLRTWWREDMSSRLNDKATGCRVVTGQRTHQLDLNGVIDEQLEEAAADGVDLEWTKVIVPARSEGRPCTVVLPGKTLADPRTGTGEPMWKEKMPDGDLHKLEMELGPYGTAGQLQQCPSPEQGGIFPRGVWRKWKVKPERWDRIYTSWDCSFKKGVGNSFVVGLTVGEAGGKLHVLKRIRRRMNWMETKAAVKENHEWAVATFGRVDHTLVEEKANGAAIISEFERTIPNIVAINPGSDSKEARANAAAPSVADGTVLVPEDWGDAEFKEWEDEFADFPNAAHDDQVDALSQLVIWWKENRRPTDAALMPKASDMQRPTSPWAAGMGGTYKPGGWGSY